jgi:hypothetical protein
MLCAVAFLLHHELAHFRLRHPYRDPGQESVEQERQADADAARWILAGCTGEILQKRSIGAMIAFITLVAKAIYCAPKEVPTHPPSFDRLLRSLQPYLPDPHHAAWGMAVIITKLHLDNAGIDAGQKTFQSARDVAEAYALLLPDRT